MSKGNPNHPRMNQVLSEPILTPIQIRTKNVRRLGYFGKPDDSYHTIIEKMLDYFDGILNKSAITLPKQSDRQSSQYRNLYLQKQED